MTSLVYAGPDIAGTCGAAVAYVSGEDRHGR